MKGRPRKEIDKKQFESLCAIQCTKQEIQDWFRVSDKTLNSWCKRTYGDTFSVVFRQKRGVGKISLRRYQFQQAEKSTAMAIFLGKNWLGQSDNPGVDVSGDEAPEDALSKSLRELAQIGIDSDQQ